MLSFPLKGYNQARNFGVVVSRFRPSVARMSKQISSRHRDLLMKAARKAMKNAYAPFSRFKVGAAILTRRGEVFAGCNVENSSYGMTNCAERTAIFSAVAQSGPKLSIRAVAVITEQDVPCSPCGACRQVIYEFGPEATIIFKNAKGWTEAPITDLLPEGFRLSE